MAGTTSTAPVQFLLPTDWTVADLRAHLGGVPLERVRMYPPPGMATDEDVLKSKSRWNRVCELIDGVLVEKTMGYLESLLAAEIIQCLGPFVKQHDLGIVLGEAGTLKILPTQVRIPDVSFIAWSRFPDRKLPKEPIPSVAPDLAIELISAGNTEAEMQRKLGDYFAAGVRLVWYIDPAKRSARAYTATDQVTEISASGTLSGGDILPGFELSLQELFSRVEQSGSA